MNNTTVTDAFGRQVAFSDTRFLATSVAGLIPVAYLVDKLNLLDPVEKVLDRFYVETKHADPTEDDVQTETVGIGRRL